MACRLFLWRVDVKTRRMYSINAHGGGIGGGDDESINKSTPFYSASLLRPFRYGAEGFERERVRETESNDGFAGLQSNPNYVIFRFRTAATLHSPLFARKIQFGPPSPSLIKLQKQYNSASYCTSNSSNNVGLASPAGVTCESADIDWDNLEFGFMPTDYMYVVKCSQGGDFSQGELQRFSNIELSPSSGVLNYGQGLFEGMKSYRTQDDKILLFRPEENALRFRMGAERMCMPSPTVEQFVEAVKFTVLANKRWIPPPHKGSLYIRPLLIGSGAILGLAPAPEYTFLIFVSPVGNYFKEGLAPINLVIETELHRATPGGTGGVKTIGNYAAVLKAQTSAKAKGYSDVLYLDSVHKRYLEEVSSCNIFLVKDNVLCTPAIEGTILPGITRKSIIDVARSQGFQVEERLVTVDELLDADEVFCTGTAVVVSPVGSIAYLDRRVSYGNGGIGVVAQQLYSALTRLQMGLTEDTMDWIVEVK